MFSDLRISTSQVFKADVGECRWGLGGCEGREEYVGGKYHPTKVPRQLSA